MIIGSPQYYKFIEHRINYFFLINRITKRKLDVILPIISKNKKILKYLIKKLSLTTKINNKMSNII